MPNFSTFTLRPTSHLTTPPHRTSAIPHHHDHPARLQRDTTGQDTTRHARTRAERPRRHATPHDTTRRDRSRTTATRREAGRGQGRTRYAHFFIFFKYFNLFYHPAAFPLQRDTPPPSPFDATTTTNPSCRRNNPPNTRNAPSWACFSCSSRLQPPTSPSRLSPATRHAATIAIRRHHHHQPSCRRNNPPEHEKHARLACFSCSSRLQPPTS